MINSDPETAGETAPSQAAVESILRSGAMGAVVLAGLATTTVVAIWLAFYFLVFVPRALAP
jgi:hypothetical protein